MSVYTSLSHTQIESFIRTYNLSPLISYAGISAGIENTNYLLNTAQGEYILTLYEHLKANELAIYLGLLGKLEQYESYYPSPLRDSQHRYLQQLAGKPAAVFPCLSGVSILQATVNQCQSIASALARLHLSSPALEFSKQNPRNMEWMQATAQQVGTYLTRQDLILLDNELNYQIQHETQHLTKGIIHADLFKDNVLFVGDCLTGMLDFYAACNDCYLLDIAITLNDWCVDECGVFDRQQQGVFMQAYQQVRVIPPEEEKSLPVLLRRACLRFWLSRIEHKLNPRVGEVTQEKPPEQFKNILLQHRQFYAQ